MFAAFLGFIESQPRLSQLVAPWASVSSDSVCLFFKKWQASVWMRGLLLPLERQDILERCATLHKFTSWWAGTPRLSCSLAGSAGTVLRRGSLPTGRSSCSNHLAAELQAKQAPRCSQVQAACSDTPVAEVASAWEHSKASASMEHTLALAPALGR